VDISIISTIFSLFLP